jgi:hypothetical protein
VTRLRTVDRTSISAMSKKCFFLPPRPPPPPQSPIKCIPEVISLEIMRPGREAYNSPPASIEIKNAGRYNSTPACVPVAWCVIKQRDNFTYVRCSDSEWCTEWYRSFIKGVSISKPGLLANLVTHLDKFRIGTAEKHQTPVMIRISSATALSVICLSVIV